MSNPHGVSMHVVTEERQDRCALSTGKLRRAQRNEVREEA